MRKQLIAVLCAACFCHTFAKANVNQDLNNFFNKLGFEGNATDARAWQGQAAGYVTGGNLYSSKPNKIVTNCIIFTTEYQCGMWRN
ncbi:TPA: conjugal transfer protein TraH [Providencia alcalifaciens]|uniref:conjugal transfer protein TraH n=1 Tax=Providencia alcalifaciens TaxID=126385 RepID=UPI000453A1BF|nr:conjugative relaxosome accessory transposon domain protein [Providencia alcalifaciens F90-2004]EUC97184.1 conjugative relaxosome accessory transposon domain protein [Providencia alcalifaciens PAL-2]